MAWLESHQTLGAHPKTRKLAHLLGVSKVTAIGHLHCFWWWAMDYAGEGDLSRYDALDIAIGAEWEGDPDTFINAMLSAGFIDSCGTDQFCIHDWDDYAGKLIERRKANAERMRAARASNDPPTKPAQMDGVPDTKDERAAHVQRTQRARVERQNTTKPNTTEPNPTEPNQPTSPAPAKVSDIDRRFESFWRAYPSGFGNKKKTREQWQRLKPDDDLFEQIMAGLDRWKRCERWQRGFVKSAEIWVRDAWWNDEPPPPTREKPVSIANGHPAGWTGSAKDFENLAKELERQGR